MSNQVILIDQCRERAGGQNLAPVLSELLGVNLDAAYRRMRGDTSLTFDEIRKICLHFNLSFDSIINYQGSLVPFQFNAMFQNRFQVLDYLKGVLQQIKVIAKAEDAKIIMTAMDLPYFRQFGFSSLSRFKFFFWQRTVLNTESHQHLKFNHEEDAGDYEELTNKIYREYHNVDSTEIWAPETLDSTIKQIQYFLESGLFESKESATAVCDDIEQLLAKLEREAQIGKKQISTGDGTNSSDFSMYQSDIFLSNNCIQAFVNDKTYTYVSFNSFNSLMSFTPHFSEECSNWIEQIRLKSILLSEVSEKLRYQFFLSLRKRLDTLREQIG